MKRTVIVFVLCTIMLAMVLAPAVARGEEKQEKYADIKLVGAKYAQLMKVFIDRCGKTKNAGDYAAAIRIYRQGMETIFPQVIRVMKKYPEIANMADPPEELKPMVELSRELHKKMTEANAKNFDYFNDPQVKEENKKLLEVIRNAQNDLPGDNEQDKSKEKGKK